MTPALRLVTDADHEPSRDAGGSHERREVDSSSAPSRDDEVFRAGLASARAALRGRSAHRFRLSEVEP